jgi:hypothetical protein
MAFPTGWAHKVAITIDHDDIDADLTNWTLVFDESFDSVLTQVNGPLDADGTRASINGGGDIRFSSDSAGSNQLACDIRTWVTNNTPGSATCEAAVGIGSVSSSVDTTIYMWWGKSGETQPAANTTYGQYNAYDSDYELVYPLDENSGSRLDRTSNQETLTPNSAPTAVDGIVGNANSFDGLSDYLYSGTSNPIEGGSTFTVECWSKAPRSQPNGYTDASIVTLAVAGETSDALGFWCDSASPGSGRSNLVSWLVAGERIESDTGQWTDDTWEHFAGTSNSTTLKLLVDGVEVTDSPKSATIGNARSNTRFVVAAWDFDLDRYERDGEIDELRISSTVRANAWIAANYDNQRNKTGFLTWGTIQDVGGTQVDVDLADTVGVTDTVTTIGVYVRAIADTIGVTDVLTTVGAFIRTIADQVGITDVLSAAMSKVVALADQVGITDVLTTTGTFVRAVADTVGITDVVNRAIVKLVTIADTVGITDVVTRLTFIGAQIFDTVGITDALSRTFTGVRGVDDQLGVTDALTASRNLVRAIADQVGVTDAIQAAAVLFVTIADTVGITDVLTTVSAALKTALLQDTVGVTDAVTYVTRIGAFIADTVGITDAVTRTATLIRTILDTVGVTDLLTRTGQYFRTIADTVGVTDVLASFTGGRWKETKIVGSRISTTKQVNSTIGDDDGDC